MSDRESAPTAARTGESEDGSEAYDPPSGGTFREGAKRREIQAVRAPVDS
jgi:hypothetical protein